MKSQDGAAVGGGAGIKAGARVVVIDVVASVGAPIVGADVGTGVMLVGAKVDAGVGSSVGVPEGEAELHE
jgi:hypothetical protein